LVWFRKLSCTNRIFRRLTNSHLTGCPAYALSRAICDRRLQSVMLALYFFVPAWWQHWVHRAGMCMATPRSPPQRPVFHYSPPIIAGWRYISGRNPPPPERIFTRKCLSHRPFLTQKWKVNTRPVFFRDCPIFAVSVPEHFFGRQTGRRFTRRPVSVLISAFRRNN